MRTLTNEDIGEATLGILYICRYEYPTLHVVQAIQFLYPSDALAAYCEIPNPESQLAAGATREKFEAEVIQLHKNMQDLEWQKELAKYL